ncbi:MAG: hypothetical protein QOC85_287 [Streptomyces sp.]|nr:hypothetical protein [Streptomyces sp.]
MRAGVVAGRYGVPPLHPQALPHPAGCGGEE